MRFRALKGYEMKVIFEKKKNWKGSKAFVNWIKGVLRKIPKKLPVESRTKANTTD